MSLYFQSEIWKYISARKVAFYSSENLFKESKRSGYIGTILADICRAVGVEVVENSQLYSDRVCNPCARKIRNLGTLFELIRNTIGSQSAVTQTPPKLAENLSKRLLDTTPGRSPCRKTVRVNSPESVKASRKSLRFDAIHTTAVFVVFITPGHAQMNIPDFIDGFIT